MLRRLRGPKPPVADETPRIPAGDSPFEQISDRKMFEVLQNAVATRSKLHIWTEGRKHQHVSRIQKVAGSEGVTLVAVPKDKKFEYILNAYAIEEVFMSVQLPHDLVYFKAKVRPSDDSTISFKLMAPLYKVQRRTAIRVPVSEDMVSKIELNVEGRAAPLPCTLLNISVGGLALMTLALDFEPEFVVGKKVSLAFQFGTLPISATGNLRYLTVVQGSLISKRLKIGVQFEDIPTKTVDEIHTYVISESTKYLGR